MMRPRPAVISFIVRIAMCLLTLALAPLAYAEGRAECSTFQSTILARSVRYCAYLPDSFDTDKMSRYPVLYYLHSRVSLATGIFLRVPL